MRYKNRKTMWELYVPAVIEGNPRFYIWKEFVIQRAGGMTLLPPVRGSWMDSEGLIHDDMMTPVRIICTSEGIDKIAKYTADFCEQKEILVYSVSDEVRKITR
jgi:hypothetical protein